MFLQYNDFLNNFAKSHFLILADKQVKGTVTNGTMNESLINYRPVIVPNYSPYKELISEYKVGILYDPKVENSLTNAMQKAKQIGCESFIPYIDNYLHTISFDKVSRELCDSLWQ